MAESLGSAVLSLTTDDSQLDAGLARAKSKSEAAELDFQKVGARMQGIGAKLSVAVTAPLTGGAAAVIASAQSIATAVPEIEKFARLSGTTTDEFQRMAFAAQSVGFEGDKLSDIYKDMQDRVGDFLQTGGGPMADFFTNIAPKVGVTADAFRDLSGPDAMQLFYNSLQAANLSDSEITFFMEAMASDATALIPLLQENGRAFDELGAKANVITPEQIGQFKEYTAAQAEMDQAFQRLTIAIVGSGLLEGVTNLVTRITDFATGLSQTSPEMMNWVLGIGAVAAAVGPVLMVLGMMVSGLSALAPVVGVVASAMGVLQTAFTIARVAALATLPALAPFLIPLAAIAAAVGAVYLAWQNWDQIAPILDAAGAAISDWWTANVQPTLDAVGGAVMEVGRFFEQIFGTQMRAVVAGVSALLRGDFAGAWRAVESFVGAPIAAALAVIERFVPGSIGHFQALYAGIREWMQTRLAAVFDWVNSRVQAVGDKFKWLWDVVVGNSYVPDLLDGIEREFRRLEPEMVKPATDAADAVAAAFAGIPSPSITVSLNPQIDPSELRIPDLSIDDAAPTIGQGRPDLSIPPPVQGEWEETFSRTFSEGLKAALDGDLKGFFQRWLDDGARRGLEGALQWLGGELGGLLGGRNGGGGGIGGILSSLFGSSGGSGGIGDFLGSLFGGGGGSGGGFFGEMFGGFAGGFATGGLIPAGQWGVVGERGPEPIISTPSGALVRPNATLSQAGMGTRSTMVSIPISIDATGADPAALGRVESQLARMQAELPGKIVQTIQDAGERGIVSPGTWR